MVYAEADHTFVDILYSFITLPLGTIVRLVAKQDDKKLDAFGSLKNLYQSLKDFPECYLAKEECKYLLLNPRSLSYDHCRNLKLNVDDTDPLTYFMCAKCSKIFDPFYSTCNKAKCKVCGKMMEQEVDQKSSVCVSGGVFASDIVTFIVTDDLCIMPYTSATIIRLLTDLGFTDNSRLEEKNIYIGCEQV